MEMKPYSLNKYKSHGDQGKYIIKFHGWYYNDFKDYIWNTVISLKDYY